MIHDVLKETRRRQLAGERIVVTNGCFDGPELHAGHLSTLRFAKEQGDFLLVLINSDKSCRRLKGEGRPIVDEKERAARLERLPFVDAVAIFDDDTPRWAIRMVSPSILVKGSDTPRPWPGEEFAVECMAAPMVHGVSTTLLAEAAGYEPRRLLRGTD